MLLGAIILNIRSFYNRFFLLGYGALNSYKLVLLTFNKNVKNIRFLKECYVNFIIGFLFWLIDVFYCDNLIFSLHWLWHFYTSKALYLLSKFILLENIN